VSAPTGGVVAPTLTTPRLLLRDALPSDAGPLLEVTFYDGRPAADVPAAGAILQRIRADQDAGETLHWVICLRDDGTPIGTVGFYRGFTGGAGELGYVLAAAHRGRGLAGEAAAAACGYGFDGLGLERIVAWTEPGNVASRRLLERLGFREDGSADGHVHYRRERPQAQDSSASGASPSPS
jgi:ribosomal-protein-alanine N-acetyltransferase